MPNSCYLIRAMPTPEAEPNADELLLFAAILGQRFIQRTDMYPKQLDDGRYVAIHQPLTETRLIAHLQGEITLGTYVLDRDSKGRFVVLDADDEPNWRRLKAIANAIDKLNREGLDPV